MSIYKKGCEQDGIYKLGGRESNSIAKEEAINGGYRSKKGVEVQIWH